MITYLTGEMVLKPVKYTFRRLPNGRGRIESEFMSLEGDYADLLINLPLLGGEVTFVEEHK